MKNLYNVNGQLVVADGRLAALQSAGYTNIAYSQGQTPYGIADDKSMVLALPIPTGKVSHPALTWSSDDLPNADGMSDAERHKRLLEILDIHQDRIIEFINEILNDEQGN